jgi:hypothetical protein
MGLDVEWEGTGPPAPWPTGYWQPCTVHGDVLVGAERFELDGSGMRLHLWGDERGAGWAAGRLDDGTTFAVPDVKADCDERGLLRSVVAGQVAGAAVAAAPVLVPGTGRLARALCRYESPDGRSGHGWAEWFHPDSGSAPA